MKPNLNSIGTKIKKEREKAGLSRRQLMMNLKSHGLDVTETTIFNWESGQRIPRADRLMIIMKTLAIAPEFFCS